MKSKLYRVEMDNYNAFFVNADDWNDAAVIGRDASIKEYENRDLSIFANDGSLRTSSDTDSKYKTVKRVELLTDIIH
tara:strand:- start:10133 stop:10363 length:231 start_codon:yes stop_codon:yes gene_type:complete